MLKSFKLVISVCLAGLLASATMAAMLLIPASPSRLSAQQPPSMPGGDRPSTALTLERAARPGSFVDVVGRRAALFGYEHRGLEAWVYPLKLLDDLQFAFGLHGYPLEIDGADALVRLRATPEATTFLYAHPAFTARQVAFAPIDEPALVVLLEVDTVLPLRIHVRFRPRLALMWPAGLQTGNAGWNADLRAYELTEETGRFAGLIGSPAAAEPSLLPYQEEPRDVPLHFVVEADAGRATIPIVISGSTNGIEHARAIHARVRGAIPRLLEDTASHYRALVADTLQVDTPDTRVNESFRWAKIAIDKGLATNPSLGTGLVAGFRTSGDSERPGFAWFFGRDALWTTFATTAYGDFATTRTALSFLRRFQREDGKVPHEISQSAAFLPWFTEYAYPWASADATPLFLAAHADYWRASGDDAFVEEAWPALTKAYQFSAATDTDANGLIENTGIGHGWVEGGALYPPHEEIYLQGVWIGALEGIAELAGAVMQDEALAAEARARAARARDAVEHTYWLPEPGAYAYATRLPTERPATAEPGPNRERRQRRLDALARERLFDERTVLTSVPLWWRGLQPDRAETELDWLGAGTLATDWGHRILSSHSQLYDPLSYHYGSVWPLFTGWASLGAYRYGRSHVGHQALMANVLLRDTHALGYVTELLSGDVQVPFGRSSHHQVWSEAMVAAPLVRGLAGLDVTAAGRHVTFAPQLPANWDRLALRNVAAGGRRLDLVLSREPGRVILQLEPRGGPEWVGADVGVSLAPAMPLDAEIRRVTVDGRTIRVSAEREGDVQRAPVRVSVTGAAQQVVWAIREGSDVYVDADAVPAGSRSRGLRVLRSRGTPEGLHLRLEGLSGEEYVFWLRTPRVLAALPDGVRRASGDEVEAARPRSSRLGHAPPPRPADVPLVVRFDGDPGAYVRRDILLRLR